MTLSKRHRLRTTLMKSQNEMLFYILSVMCMPTPLNYATLIRDNAMRKLQKKSPINRQPVDV